MNIPCFIAAQYNFQNTILKMIVIMKQLAKYWNILLLFHSSLQNKFTSSQCTLPLCITTCHKASSLTVGQNILQRSLVGMA